MPTIYSSSKANNAIRLPDLGPRARRQGANKKLPSAIS